MKDRTVNNIVCITLFGLPERVHQIADALYQVDPDMFDWLDATVAENGFEILLKGKSVTNIGQSNHALLLWSANS